MDYLDFLQKVNNFLYKYFGLNSVTLKLQIKINNDRYELDLTDINEIISDDGFIQ